MQRFQSSDPSVPKAPTIQNPNKTTTKNIIPPASSGGQSAYLNSSNQHLSPSAPTASKMSANDSNSEYFFHFISYYCFEHMQFAVSHQVTALLFTLGKLYRSCHLSVLVY
jgi:hypothetical protein